MDKKKLIDQIRTKLEAERLTLVEAAKATYEAATHEESKPENEYDTRGLEASYLAGAQAKRVTEIEEMISICKNLSLKDFDSKSPISSSALINVKYNGKDTYVFLMPKGGGITIHWEEKNILVIAPNSPLGASLLGLKQGDTALVETDEDIKEYNILSVE